MNFAILKLHTWPNPGWTFSREYKVVWRLGELVPILVSLSFVGWDVSLTRALLRPQKTNKRRLQPVEDRRIQRIRRGSVIRYSSSLKTTILDQFNWTDNASVQLCTSVELKQQEEKVNLLLMWQRKCRSYFLCSFSVSVFPHRQPKELTVIEQNGKLLAYLILVLFLSILI